MANKEKKIAEFHLRENGPIKITGDFILIDSGGNEIKSINEVYICRCGASGKMPYCDGAHRKTGVKK